MSEPSLADVVHEAVERAKADEASARRREVIEEEAFFAVREAHIDDDTMAAPLFGGPSNFTSGESL